jgi:hypothetical protein
VEPQEYEHLTRRLAAIEWLNLQSIAEQDPTLTSLKRALKQNHAIARMDLQGLQDCCTQLAAKYGVDNNRDA